MRLLPLLLVAACVNGIHDPNDTGLLIKPPPGIHDGPITLSVVNRTGQEVQCDVIEVDRCLPLAAERVKIPTGDRWEVDDVLCADVDVICLFDPNSRTEIPVRTWRWFVQPAIDE